MGHQATYKSTKSSAQGPFLGYSLQLVRFFYHLLTANNDATVTFEELDDVAVEGADGSVLLEQDKNAIDKGNPAADSANDFWKTIGNWADLIRDGHIKASKTSFLYYAVGPKVTAGGLVSRISTAASPEAAASTLDEINQYFDGKAQYSERYASYLKFDALTIENKIALIIGFQLKIDNSSPLSAVRSIISATVSQKNVDAVIEFGLGYCFNKVTEAIRQKRETGLTPKEFKRHFQAYVRRHNVAGYLAPKSVEPTDADIDTVLNDGPIFIRQLELVSASEEVMTRAVSDYLRTEADKVTWADEGEVFEGSFEEFDGSLLRRYSTQKDEISDLMTDKPAEVRGRVLYGRCISASVLLEGREVPSHFVPGAFNHLSEAMRLGWHPEFEVLLSSGGEE